MPGHNLQIELIAGGVVTLSTQGLLAELLSMLAWSANEGANGIMSQLDCLLKRYVVYPKPN